MFRNIFLVIAFGIFVLNINSQIKETKFGFKAGSNFLLSQNIENERTFNGAVLYHIGLVSEIVLGIKKKLSIQTELLFSSQGFNEIYYNNPIYKINQYKEKVYLGYLNLPILSTYKLNEFIGLEAGPYLSYLLFNKKNFNVLNGSSDFHPNDKYYIWNKDFGLILGVIYYTNKFVNVSLRYNYGLLNIVEFTDYNTQMIQLSIEYIPKINKRN